jgi:hypothetical protein
LESLKDPGNGLDQQSEAVAKGYYDLRHVFYQQKGDLVKSEKLVRESLRIRTHLYSNHVQVGITCGAHILQGQGELGIETKEPYERSLAINIKNSGSEGVNTAASNFNQGNFCHQQAEASQSAGICGKSIYHYRFPSLMKHYEYILFGPDHPNTVEASSQLSIITYKLLEA